MPLKIVYIDDEPELCEAFAENFGSSSISIRTFSDPAAGVRSVLESPPDLVFIDYRLPGTTGDEIAREIGDQITKVLITGELDVVTQAHFARKFPKPFPWSEIEQYLAEQLELASKR